MNERSEFISDPGDPNEQRNTVQGKSKKAKHWLVENDPKWLARLTVKK